MIFILCVLVAIGAVVVWRLASRKVAEQNVSYRSFALVSGLTALVFVALAVMQCFTIVPAGHTGVVNFFGLVSKKTLPPGINLVNPLAKVHTYSVQTKEHKEVMQVLSSEGLTIGLEISVLYRLNPDSAARVYQTIVGGTMRTLCSSRSSARSAGL
jgi:regulator of protease activity HflC (stomatin/prohibitin superfamily)